MDKERKLIVAGNWKSNKTNSEAVALVSDLIRELAAVKEVDVVRKTIDFGVASSRHSGGASGDRFSERPSGRSSARWSSRAARWQAPRARIRGRCSPTSC